MKYLIILLSSLFLCDTSVAAAGAEDEGEKEGGSPKARVGDAPTEESTSLSDATKVMSDIATYTEELENGNAENIEKARKLATDLMAFEGEGKRIQLMKTFGQQLNTAIQDFEKKSKE